MSKPKEDRQSEKQPRELEAEVKAIMEHFAPDHLSLVNSLRRRIKKRLPTANEIVYAYRSWYVISYSPSEKGYEGVLSIRVSEEGVRLYLNSTKALKDPEKRLNGSGKQAKWIPIEKATELNDPSIAHLIEQAICASGVPFAEQGKGALVIRSSR